MNETTQPSSPPASWLQDLAESEAERAAGLSVPSELIHRELEETIARLEAKATARHAEATARR